MKILCMFQKLAITILLLLVVTFVQAQRTASVSGDWSNNATWGGADFPTTSDDVTINSGVIVTVDIASASAASITFPAHSSSAGITIIGSNVLTVTGAVVMNAATAASTTTLDVGSGTLNAGSITISGANNANWINSITISSGTINCTGNFTFNSGNQPASAVLDASAVGAQINIDGNLKYINKEYIYEIKLSNDKNLQYYTRFTLFEK